jgi:hypothetical protein
MADLPAAWGESFHGRNAGMRSPSSTVSLAAAPTVDRKAAVPAPTWRITIRVRGIDALGQQNPGTVEQWLRRAGDDQPAIDDTVEKLASARTREATVTIEGR